MILQSIELDNFMCYAGPNRFDFTEGINIIIGDNGYGKSKLFDAFYWVMYNQCFNTTIKKHQYTNQLKRSIISDKAVNDLEEGIATASVTLTFYNPEKDNVYILQRKYSIRKSGDKLIEDQDSDEVIWQKEMSYMQAKEVTDKDQIERIKRTILPDNIKPYMWFQGEQVESIIDFNKSDTLTNAINILSSITRYDNLISVAEGVKETATKEYSKKQRDLSGDKSKSESLELDRQKLLDRIKGLELQEVQIKDNLATAEGKRENLLNKVADAQKIKDIDAKKSEIHRNLKELQDEYNTEQINLHKRMFTSKWVLKGTENLFVEYSSLYNEFEQRKMMEQARRQAKIEAETTVVKELRTRLPMDVPEPIYVEQMLKDEHCLVCDRPAPKDSAAWLKIKELIDRSEVAIKSLEDDEDKSIHNFSADLKKLYQNGLGLSHIIKNVDEDIIATHKRIKKLDRRRKSLTDDLFKLEAEVSDAIRDASINVNEANNILNEVAAQYEIEKRFQREEYSTSGTIEKLKDNFTKIEADLSKLVVGEIPPYLVEKVKAVNEFFDVAVSTRKRVFNNLVQMLETEANKHYLEMTQGNISARGVIKLKELPNGKNYMPELVDENGNILLQLNTGNIILIKLATIMAIISARQGSRNTDLYTLITDAPMSVFGEGYTIGFCKTVSHVYKQSIIMSKEFYRNMSLRNQLLNSPEIKLGKVYLITPTISESSRSNRNSLSTFIEKLN